MARRRRAATLDNFLRANIRVRRPRVEAVPVQSRQIIRLPFATSKAAGLVSAADHRFELLGRSVPGHRNGSRRATEMIAQLRVRMAELPAKDNGKITGQFSAGVQMRHGVGSDVVPAIFDFVPIAPVAMVESSVPAIANPWHLARADPSGHDVKRRVEFELIENLHGSSRAVDETVIKRDRDEAVWLDGETHLR